MIDAPLRKNVSHSYVLLLAKFATMGGLWGTLKFKLLAIWKKKNPFIDREIVCEERAKRIGQCPKGNSFSYGRCSLTPSVYIWNICWGLRVHLYYFKFKCNSSMVWVWLNGVKSFRLLIRRCLRHGVDGTLIPKPIKNKSQIYPGWQVVLSQSSCFPHQLPSRAGAAFGEN